MNEFVVAAWAGEHEGDRMALRLDSHRHLRVHLGLDDASVADPQCRTAVVIRAFCHCRGLRAAFAGTTRYRPCGRSGDDRRVEQDMTETQSQHISHQVLLALLAPAEEGQSKAKAAL
jgi:hypothetical protein